MNRSLQVAAIIALAAVLAACATRPGPEPGHEPRPAAPSPAPAAPVEPASLPGWAADPLDGLAAAIARQCALRAPPAPWPALCAEFAALDDGGAPAASGAARPTLRDWLAARFAAWPLQDARGGVEGLITGYYEPLLTGSRRRESPAQVPLYGRPPDLLTIDLAGVEPKLSGLRLRGRLQGQRVVPYHSRADIETASPLAGHELIWVDDPVDAFFLEIQGSGRVRLRDGTTVRVGYADQNGHPYRAIGRTLIERGALRAEEVTAPAIRRWLRENPQQAPEVMRGNPSQVFFRELPAPPPPAPGEPEAGPPGSLGVPLTAARSLAVDRSVVPLGSLVWLDTADPIDGRPLRRAMAAQDTGGAIAGAIRADFFWGFGERAERAAGLMRSPGRLWVLWPRGEAPPGRALSR
ncbi:MAG TPA: MltA domain-containing protein [Burkholderiaceae bacterium]|nr:MltA domain-containing protein [Burkholderiaceae bacterium]